MMSGKKSYARQDFWGKGALKEDKEKRWNRVTDLHKRRKLFEIKVVSILK